MKRFLAVVLAVAMVAAFVPAAVADGEIITVDLENIITTAADYTVTDKLITVNANEGDTVLIQGDGTPNGTDGGWRVHVTGTATDITLAAGTVIIADNGHALQVPGDSTITGKGDDITITSNERGIYTNGGSVTITGTFGDITGNDRGIYAVGGSVTITGTLGDITGGFNGIVADGGGSVIISGTTGDITGTGGSGTSGISASNSVTISGTVTSISGTTHGIRVGGRGGSVTISGTVGNISGGSYGINILEGTGTFTVKGNGVAFVSGTIWATQDHKSGILFVGDTGTVYGNVTLKGELTIEDGQTLTVPDGASLTVPSGVTLTNNGTINSRSGGITGEENISGNDVIYPPETDESEKDDTEPDEPYTPPSTDTTTTTETSETPFFAYFEPTPPVSDADTPSDWAKAAVEEARKLGLIPEHLDGSWRRWLNRAEFAAFAVLLYEHLDGRTITAWSLFDDTTDANVEKLAGLGIVKGDGTGKFNPDGNFSREMALTLMYNIMIKLGYYLPSAEPNFSDADSISPWAREAIGALQRAGIIKGDGTRFNAQETFSREMGVVTMAQILEWVG
ncbi:MAG: S-layer homology domain-containing protein [Oscillospiraceae bacterium]|nr:S-layer homology domain-containing protein [Oscillospiraceae bacterium]